MRRILFFFCMAIIMMSTVSAKVWTGSEWIDERYPQGAKWQEAVIGLFEPYLREYEVNGTVEYEGKTYKKIWCNGELYRYLREDDDALYYLYGPNFPDIDNDCVEVKYWDLKWEKGEVFNLRLYPIIDSWDEPQNVVADEITTCTGQDGKEYDCMHFSGYEGRFIEEYDGQGVMLRSVGRISESIIGIVLYLSNGESFYALKFERNGEVVWKNKDYDEWMEFLGVEGVKVDKATKNNAPQGIFDIYGRKLPTAPTSGFYIENGEKKLAK